MRYKHRKPQVSQVVAELLMRLEDIRALESIRANLGRIPDSPLKESLERDVKTQLLETFDNNRGYPPEQSQDWSGIT